MIENMVIKKEVTTMTVKLEKKDVENIETVKLISEMQAIFDELKTRLSPVATKSLRDLPVGTLVRDPVSKYYGAPISFLVADHGYYGDTLSTLLSEKILTFKAFDAAEPNNPDRRRADYGNNDYQVSNIGLWLNSNKSNWFVPLHEYDQAPTSERVSSRPYVGEKGFLTNFDEKFKQNINDSVVGKVFLLSAEEVGLSDGGKVLELFKNGEFRKAKPTKECVQVDGEGDENEPDWWWLRTPYAGYSLNVRYVNSSGAINSNYAFYGHLGVRPALNLSSEIRVSSEPDANGIYDIIWD